MRVVSLASGSSGNATLVVDGDAALLIDAGLPLRTLAGRLWHAGFDPQRLSGVVLTHEHTDHTSGALALAQRYHTPLMADPRTLAAVLASLPPDADQASVRTEAHAVGTRWRLGHLDIASFAVPHDAVAPCGYLIGTDAWRLCLVTDCGTMNDTILRHLRKARLIILEANHDREMLRRGPYPQHLKRRILSPEGHLANDEAAEALCQSMPDDAARWVWLAHLSRTNNTPDLALATVTARLGAGRRRATTLAVTRPGLGPTWESSMLVEQLTLL